MPGFDNELERIVGELNRVALGGAPESTVTSRRSPLAPLSNNCSDLPPIAAPPTRSVAEFPVIFHINGSIAPGRPTPLSPDDVQNLLAPMFTPEQRRDLQQKRSLDFSFVRPNGKRCRANIHYQRGTMAACTAVRNPSRP